MITFYGSAGAASGTTKVSGNGFVANIQGQLVGRDVIAVHPAQVENPTGQGGPLIIRTAAQRVLASGRVNGAVTTDQPLAVIGAEEFIVRSIVFTRASAVPDAAMKGGVYTLPGKAGQVLVPATQGYDTLAEPVDFNEVEVSTGEISTAPFIYVSLTTANPSPIEMEVHVIGDVLRYAAS